jgi:hypothetical protein
LKLYCEMFHWGKTFIEPNLQVGSPVREIYEHSIIEVESRNPQDIVTRFPGVLRFQFFEKDGSMEGTERFEGRNNLSPKYFPGGKLASKEEMEIFRQGHVQYRRDNECKGWTFSDRPFPESLVLPRGGFVVQEFGKDCELIDPASIATTA